MKKLLLIMISCAASFAFAMPAMNVFTINTADPLGYLAWARDAGPVTGPPSNTSVGGVCMPSYGAEEVGDMYYFNIFDSHADSLSGDVYDPEIAAEIAKIADKRTVRMVEHFTPLTPVADGFEIGMTYPNYNINVYTQSPQRYVKELTAYQSVVQANGFEDVTFSAFQINTGDDTGKILVAIQAPSNQRLGEYLDARGESWNAAAIEKFPKLRKLKRGFILACEIVYAK